MAVSIATAGKNAMLDRLGVLCTHIGLFDESAAITSVTALAADDTFTKTAHGLTDGNLVVLRSITPTSGTGVFDEKSYYVINSAANTFKLARTSGGTAVNILVDITSVSVVKLVEISGGTPAYARKAIAWSAAAEGTMTDSTNGATFDVPASTVNYVGGFSASSGGTLYWLKSVSEVIFGAQSTYTVSNVDINLTGDET